MIFYLMVIVMTLLGAFGAFLFKMSGDRIAGIAFLLKEPRIYLGAAFYVASAVINIVLLRYMEYSVLYPMSAITYIWSMLLSKYLRGEAITRRKIIGILAICMGLVFIAR